MYREYLKSIEKGEMGMCELCWQTPCHDRCPNAREPEEVGMPPHYCESCGMPMYAGEEGYDLGGQVWCAECVRDAAFTVE